MRGRPVGRTKGAAGWASRGPEQQQGDCGTQEQPQTCFALGSVGRAVPPALLQWVLVQSPRAELHDWQHLLPSHSSMPCSAPLLIEFPINSPAANSALPHRPTQGEYCTKSPLLLAAPPQGFYPLQSSLVACRVSRQLPALGHSSACPRLLPAHQAQMRQAGAASSTQCGCAVPPLMSQAGTQRGCRTHREKSVKAAAVWHRIAPRCGFVFLTAFMGLGEAVARLEELMLLGSEGSWS